MGTLGLFHLNNNNLNQNIFKLNKLIKDFLLIIILSGKASDKKQGLISLSNTSSGLMFSSHCDVSFKLIVEFITNKASSSIVGPTSGVSWHLIFTTYNLRKKGVNFNWHVS